MFLQLIDTIISHPTLDDPQKSKILRQLGETDLALVPIACNVPSNPSIFQVEGADEELQLLNVGATIMNQMSAMTDE